MSEENEVNEFYRATGETVRTIVAVIDTVAGRGGFRGEELSAIGKLRDNCVSLSQMVEAHESK